MHVCKSRVFKVSYSLGADEKNFTELYWDMRRTVPSEAHVAHSQGGQGGKSKCSPLLVLGAKVPFSNGKTYCCVKTLVYQFGLIHHGN